MSFISYNLIIIILLINTLISIAVFVFGLWQPSERRGTVLLLAWFFFICPVVGPIFVLSGMLLNHFYEPREIDLSVINFSKNRKETVLAPDAEMELNYASLDDAMAVADTKKVRNLLINILKNDNISVFTGVARAVDSSDTEISHYAAAAILDILSDFRIRSRELLFGMRQYPEDADHNIFILEYLHHMLEMGIMNKTEHRATVDTMNEVAENLFTYNLWHMKAEHYLWICDHLISVGNDVLVQTWLGRARKYRPNELSTYKACLRAYYNRKDIAAFFACMQELKHTDIVVDKEILNLFRLYG